MNCVRFIDRLLAADANVFPNQSWSDSEFRELKIRITREDIGSCDLPRKCGN